MGTLEVQDCPPWAVVGARVVCINAAKEGIGSLHNLTEGTTYTISWVGIRTDVGAPTWSIHVAELRHWFQSNPELLVVSGYSVARFRPLIEKTVEQDVSEHFRTFLTTTNTNTREKETT